MLIAMQAIEENVKTLNMLLEVSLINDVDEYRWDSRTKTRTQAVRDLLRLGLAAYYKEQQKGG